VEGPGDADAAVAHTHRHPAILMVTHNMVATGVNMSYNYERQK
jgi:hypothetical protein